VKKRRLPSNSQPSPNKVVLSQHVSQVPSPQKDEDSQPSFVDDSRCLSNLSKKLEKEFKRFDKEQKKVARPALEETNKDCDTSNFPTKNRFCSQLIELSKKTLKDRNAWLHSLNSRSKNKREEKPRKRLPVRLFNMQSAQFGFITCNFEIDYSRTDDTEHINLVRPRIVFPVNLANEMGLGNGMVIEIVEPWQVIACEKNKCDYIMSPFWIQVVRRNTIDDENQAEQLNRSDAAKAKDCVANFIDGDQLSFETIYAHPDTVV
jgi:hypothetical protein